MELKIKIDDINYRKMVKVAFPILKKEAERSSGLWAQAIRSMKAPDDKSIDILLGLIPDSMKIRLIMTAFEKNKYSICRQIESFGASKGIHYTVSDLDLKI